MSHSHFYFQSPIGILCLELSVDGLRSVHFVEEMGIEVVLHPQKVDVLRTYLEEYFSTGFLAEFPIDPQIGTPFQRSVWQALKNIPKGQTASYLDIAKRINLPKGAQAVGNANGQNPVLLFYPCHRVIGSTGKLVGYSGGLWRKEWLLAKEGATLF
jgi:methylated-DNA-[protein]-cysteine S-methyltransferase